MNLLINRRYLFREYFENLCGIIRKEELYKSWGRVVIRRVNLERPIVYGFLGADAWFLYIFFSWDLLQNWTANSKTTSNDFPFIESAWIDADALFVLERWIAFWETWFATNPLTTRAIRLLVSYSLTCILSILLCVCSNRWTRLYKIYSSLHTWSYGWSSAQNSVPLNLPKRIKTSSKI